MRIGKTAMLGALAAAYVPSSASAQSINPVLDRNQVESRVVGAITIPLGQSSDQRRTAARFEIISSSRANDTSAILLRDEKQRWQERRIGITLDSTQTLTVNGAPLSSPENRANISDGAAIAIGVVALVGITAIVVSDVSEKFVEPFRLDDE